MERNEGSLRHLWDNINVPIFTLQGSQKEKRERRDPRKHLKTATAENFLKMGEETLSQVQEAQRVPGRINPRRNTPRHIVIKLIKITD